MPKIAAVQMSMSESMEHNYEKSLSLLRSAAKKGAELICFPEGQLSRYVAQYPELDIGDFAVEPDSEFIKGLQAECKSLGVMACISPCIERSGKVYSCCMLISDSGKILHTEAKKHIVRAKHFYEQDYFTAGDEPFKAVDTPYGKIGLIVCFDRHYPESFRSLALQGCSLAIVPVANDLTEPLELFEWEMRVPAFQNGMYILMANRVGTEGGMTFAGGSIIASPDGDIIARAGNGEEILLADVDFGKCAEARERTQYLKLRRGEVFTI